MTFGVGWPVARDQGRRGHARAGGFRSHPRVQRRRLPGGLPRALHRLGARRRRADRPLAGGQREPHATPTRTFPGAVSASHGARARSICCSPADARFHGLDVAARSRSTCARSPTSSRTSRASAARSPGARRSTPSGPTSASATPTSATTTAPSAPSRVTGSGRVTAGDRATAFDVTLDAAPLSFSSLARSYRLAPLPRHVLRPAPRAGDAEPAHGADAAHRRRRARSPSMSWWTSTRSAARGRRAPCARAASTRAAPRTAVAPADAASTRSSTNDVHGDSLATMDGRADITLDTSRVAEIWVPHATARAAVAGGHLRVDSLTLTSTGVRARAVGDARRQGRRARHDVLLASTWTRSAGCARSSSREARAARGQRASACSRAPAAIPSPARST